ncbi:MAG: winged helix-turn-helix transcriptional regulator [Polyangiales bacterium]
MTSSIPPDSGCNAREILDRVGDKWSVLAIVNLGGGSMRFSVNLGGGSMRFSELLRNGHGVSQRMLTQTLRNLERDGIVWRKVTPTVPITVEYGLTDLGAGLLEVLRPLFEWSGTHMKAIAKARAAYDARGTKAPAASPAPSSPGPKHRSP